MARISRVVIPGCPHHVTQRGNHRQDVFFRPEDRRPYLQILQENCEHYQLDVLAYCLMTNHVHLVVFPHRLDSMAKALGRTHNDYARWIHVKFRQVGHLWQNRFYSCPLETIHLHETLRYVELNPVRAGLAQHAWEWDWSSAAVHTGEAAESIRLRWDEWKQRWDSSQWKQVLDFGHRDAALLQRIREATRTGRPLGEAAFIDCLERQTGRVLHPQRRGPKRQEAAVGVSFGVA